MPFIQVQTQQKHVFTPGEASAIGGAWRSVAGQVRSVAGELQAIGGALSSSWEGNAKQQFMALYDGVPSETHSSADLLDGLAGQVEGFTVTEWITQWETVWSPEP